MLPRSFLLSQGCAGGGLSKKIIDFMFAAPFSVDINTRAADFQTERMELQSDVQLNDLIVSL